MLFVWSPSGRKLEYTKENHLSDLVTISHADVRVAAWRGEPFITAPVRQPYTLKPKTC